MPTTAALEAQIAELRGQVEALQNEARAAAEQARRVINPADPFVEQAAANKREREAKEAWRRKAGYTAAPGPQLSIAEQTEEYQRAVTAALRAEREQKEALRAQLVANAKRRAELIEAGEPQPDQFARAAASAQRQREIELDRVTRVEPTVEDGLANTRGIR